MKKILSYIKNTFIQGGIILTATNFSISLLNYLSNSLVAKTLGPDGFGEFSSLLAYISIFSMPSFIITAIIIRRLGYAGTMRDKVAQVFERWMWKKLKKWSSIIPIFIVLSLGIPKITGLTIESSFALAIILVVNFIGFIYIALFQGIRAFWLYAITMILISIGRIGGAIISYISTTSILTIYIGMILGYSAPAIIGIRRFRLIDTQTFHKKAYVLNKSIRNIINKQNVLITSLSLISITLIGNLDIAVAKKVLNSNDVGFYGGWSLFSKIILYTAGPLNALSIIFFSSKEHSKKYTHIMFFVIAGIAFAGTALLLIYKLFGVALVVLLLNDEFLSISPLLTSAAVFGTLYTLITLVNNYFIARNSKASLIIFASVLLYSLCLFIFGKTIDSLIMVNIWITSITACVYLIVFMYHSLLMKGFSHEKKR